VFPFVDWLVGVVDLLVRDVDPWANPTPAINETIITAGTVFFKFMGISFV
jgi:hypothetical protein